MYNDDDLNLFQSWTKHNGAIPVQKLYFPDNEMKSNFNQHWNYPILGARGN